MRVLTVNAGSTSVKIERYDLPDELPPIESPPAPTYTAESGPDFDETLRTSMGEPVDLVAHRFVRLPDDAPAVLRLDADTRRKIETVGSDAPLHDAEALSAVAAIERLRPGLPQYAVSDSAFHRTLSEAASTYALPRDVTARGLHRIGYHGLSHEYAAHRGCALAGLALDRARVVTAHLGGGSSLCAIGAGASVDTTMGYTPLEGLPMATRSGSVDPGLLIHLLRNGMTVAELEDMLERRSGLLGISGITADVRELIALPEQPAARLALDVLGWRLRASLGAMTAVLGGVDLIVFTGGIGEHASAIRSAALNGGLGIGVRLDEARNAASLEGPIASGDSAVAVCIVSARENWQLARACASVAS
jgi:acetate kinase